MKRRYFFAAAVCIASVSLAQEQPFVRVDVSPQEVSVGEPVRVRVTVLGPSWFPEPPVFPGFEVPNSIVRLPPDSSRATSERIGRATWSGVVRNYQIYPLIGARYRLDGLAIKLTYADPGNPPIALDIDVPPIEFLASVPVGAEKLDPYIAGQALTFTRELDGDPTSLEVGDALVLTYTAELDGLPAIFLPPLVDDVHIDGVSVYVEEAVVEDGRPSRRSEKLTLVFKSGGEVSIPEVSLDWWSTKTKQIETAVIPALSFSVFGPSGFAVQADNGPRENSRSMTIAIVAVGFMLLLWFSRRSVFAFSQRLRETAAVRRQSEAYAFKQLRKAVHGREPRAVHRALLIWLQCLQPGTEARQFARDCGDGELRRNIDALSAANFSSARKTPDLRGLLRGLAVARRHFQRSPARVDMLNLPPLNP